MTDHPHSQEVILLRLGEVFLKGENRPFFERILLEKARRAVAHLDGAKVEKTYGRMVCWPGTDGIQPALRALSRLFGLTSLSPARLCERDVAQVTATAVEEMRREVARLGRKPTFKVESRRADKRFPLNSLQLSREIGHQVIEALDLKVDVHTPECTLGVEIGWDYAFVFAGSEPGVGGLPVGGTGRAELLLSGGIDSPVAGWLMMKRGCVLGATYFHSFPYTGEKTEDKVVRLAQLLANWQLDELPLKIVPFTDAQKALRAANPDGKLAVVLYRRMMLRVAERLARKANAKALVTGDALAQVASQTLENLGTIGAATSMALLRPCLGHDKQETIELARKIGTFETSIEPYDDCCSLFVPEHPHTKALVHICEKVEATLDVAALVDDLVARTTVRVLRPQ